MLCIIYLEFGLLFNYRQPFFGTYVALLLHVYCCFDIFFCVFGIIFMSEDLCIFILETALRSAIRSESDRLDIDLSD